MTKVSSKRLFRIPFYLQQNVAGIFNKQSEVDLLTELQLRLVMLKWKEILPISWAGFLLFSDGRVH
jgi:hypothetical protein